MACFLISAAEAVVVTVLEKKARKKESLAPELHKEIPEDHIKIPFSRKLSWLKYMLWGGVALLAFEHIWHGEVVPWFPFLTAMSDPADAAEMLKEIATVGVCMALLITLVWFIICKVADHLVKKSDDQAADESTL